VKSLLLEAVHPSGVNLLTKDRYTVDCRKQSLSEDELIAALDGVSLLGIRSRTHVTRRVLESAPDLLAVGAYCIGTNQIDLEAASEHGVAVFNAPYSNTRSVAEMVIGQIIFLMRGLYDKIAKAHRGEWDKSSKGSHEIRGKNLGIIGYGNIGSQVSMMAEALGMRVYYYDSVDKLNIGNAVKMSSLEEVLEIADVVTLHVDGSPENANFIGEAQFARMRDGVMFLNLSRGHIVDIAALVKNLESGKIAGAALDVFPEEPAATDTPFISPLQKMPNVLLTPHVGGSTEEAQNNIGEFVSGKLIEYCRTGSSYTSVNLPGIQLPEMKNTHRLLHIHKNVPGVLSQLNTIFAQNQVNVVGQYLRTNEAIGYVIADVDSNYNESLLDDLQKVANTIRVRILY
jgi:D-3-phosphoglycerate dehydrogenase / 2-oxoglutarate reductase